MLYIRNSQDLIKAGMIILVDGDYLTDDGRILKRVYTGRRHTTLRWQSSEDGYNYRNLFEAYYREQY